MFLQVMIILSIINTGVVAPAAFIFMMYGFGFMVLRGDWHLFLYGVYAFTAAIIAEIILGCLGE